MAGKASAVALKETGAAAPQLVEKHVLNVDQLVHERVRLGILSALVVNESLSFKELKSALDTTDGNLSVHARKLEEAGYVTCQKSFAGRMPKTEYRLTSFGKKMFEKYLSHMEALIQAMRGQGRRADMERAGLHAAIIMDGNGRWAERRGLPRLAGHVQGERTLRRIVESAPDCGVGTLTVYAFSADNWKRPQAEVDGLMQLLQLHLSTCTDLCRERGVRVSIIGRRDRLQHECVAVIEQAEELTQDGARLHLRIAVDYSSRHAIAEAWRAGRGAYDRAALNHSLNSPDVDLLIRTGGEQRLSDFLLWECAYAELFFTPCLWPDFAPDQLRQIVKQFGMRERRFGGLPAVVGPNSTNCPASLSAQY